MLTVVIPTYNRNQKLLATVEKLLPQFTEQCQLLILDNASPVPVDETLRPVLERFPGCRVEIRRNRANIGANANILRCFESCETPYLWTLSDDDDLKSDAIRTIFEHLEAHPDCVFFNFGVDHYLPRSKTTLTRGALDFVRNIDSLGNTIFISSNIYKNDALLGSLKFAHHYTYCAMPQFVMVIQSLDDSSECCFSHRSVVDLGLTEFEAQWSRVVLSLGVRTVLEIPLDPKVRAALAPRVIQFEESYMTMRQQLFQLIQSAVANRDRRGSLYLYDQLRQRRYGAAYFSNKQWKPRLQAMLLRPLLVYPHLGRQLFAWNHRLKKAPPEARSVQSFSDRL